MVRSNTMQDERTTYIPSTVSIARNGRRTILLVNRRSTNFSHYYIAINLALVSDWCPLSPGTKSEF